jgi:hypothetical protein
MPLLHRVLLQHTHKHQALSTAAAAAAGGRRLRLVVIVVLAGFGSDGGLRSTAVAACGRRCRCRRRFFESRAEDKIAQKWHDGVRPSLRARFGASRGGVSSSPTATVLFV